MAGSVEDKYSFVLDEFGESSGVEEGAISDEESPQNNYNNVQESGLKTPVETPKQIVDMEIDSESETNDRNNRDLEPILKLTFRNQETNKRYRKQILELLSKQIQPCGIVSRDERDLEVEVWGPKPEESMFEIDVTPTEHVRNRDVPVYGRIEFILSDGVEIPKTKPSTLNCFNCLGSHNLRDCPKPKDQRQISKNRATFQNNRYQKSSRYHLDESQKYSHLLPGVISNKLRHALSLDQNQLPPFIYRMRQLGYPPGWLEEAKVSHSGVSMYDNNGRLVLEDGDEEGEIIADGAKDKYDVTKILEFPGFNIPADKDVVDESSCYHCPRISEDQSKQCMVDKLRGNAAQAYKKKTLNKTSNAPSTTEEKLSQGSESPKPAKKRKGSPTIEEMEDKKRQLLEALDTDTNPGTEAKREVEEVEARQVHVGHVRGVDFGTPTLKSVSPFSKLPTRESFMVNVSDVINFENLPDSTGKYETMVHLITKIRHSVAKIQSENDK